MLEVERIKIMGEKPLKLKSDILFAIFPSFLISLSLILGYTIKHFHKLSINVSLAFAWLGIFLGLLIINSVLFYCLDRKISIRKEETVNLQKGTLYWLVSSIALFIAYIPTFLGLYPGLFNYDATGQYEEYINHAVSMHHPYIHTYFVGICCSLGQKIFSGGINKGVAIYCLLQMMIVSMGLGYVLYYLKTKRVSKPILIFSFVFFAFFPPISLHAVSVTKDGIFCVLVIDFIVVCYEFMSNRDEFMSKKTNVILLILVTSFTVIMRNNARYAIVLIIPFMAVGMIRDLRKKKHIAKYIGIILAISLILALYYGPLAKALTVKGINQAEKLSIPTQQLVRVHNYCKDLLTEEQNATIEQLFIEDVAFEYYIPEIADTSKARFNQTEFKNNKKKYIDFYIQLGKEYPNVYLESILENTYGFWYPWSKLVLTSSNELGFIPVDCYPPAQLNSIIKPIETYYKQFEAGEIVMSKTWISWIFMPATYLYIFIICLTYAIKKKDIASITVGVFIIALWGTFILGPVALVRYSLYLIMLFPVEVAYLISRRDRYSE